MAKIDLNTVSSGYLSQAALNANFTAIEDEFQNKVLYRDNPSGEPNSMQTHLDMNGYYVLNAGNPSLMDADNIAYTADATGAETRTIAEKLNDVVSVKDFGAVGDGVTDDTAAFLAAMLESASEVYVPSGTYFCSTLNPTQVTKKLTGPGFTVFGGDYLDHRVNDWALVSGTPSSWSNPGDPANAMAGDFVGKSGIAKQTYITGAATAGQNTTGYHTRTDLAPSNLNFVFSSGYNHSTSNTDGRTGVGQYSSYIVHTGQGDLFHYYGGGYVNNPTPNRNSHWLADPAITVLAGGVSTVTPSANLVAIELQVQDNGHAVTGSGSTFHLYRTAAVPSPNTKEYVWVGSAVTSRGTVPIDAMYTGAGDSRIGIDFSTASFTDSNTAIALKRGQAINFNSTNSSFLSTPDKTTPGNTFLYMDGSAAKLIFNVNGVGSLAVTSTSVGVGTVTPGVNLDVQNSGTVTTRVTTTDTSGGNVGQFSASYTGGGGGTASAVSLQAGNGYAQVLVNSNSPLLFSTNNTERARLNQNGKFLIGTNTDTGGALLQVNDNRIRISVAKTPASATDTGTSGEWCWDTNYVYVCVSANTWKRAALTTW